MKRTPVQLCAIGEKQQLCVLADDGTMWLRVVHPVINGGTKTQFVTEWKQIDPLPSDTSNLTKIRN